MKYAVAIFDDNEERLMSVSYLLSMTEDIICTCAKKDCSTLLEDIERAKPDLVLMDISMPGVDGVQATALLKQHYPELPVVMQTVYEDDDNIFNSLKAGANGYLLKTMPPEKFLHSLYEALRGGAPMSPAIAVKVLHYFRKERVEPEAKYDLTSREKEILVSLVDGLSYKQIAAQYRIAYNTVNNHIRSIYEKLHVNSAPAAVRIAIKNRLA